MESQKWDAPQASEVTEKRAGMRRILILTADTGFGHRSAAKAIAEALNDHYGGRGEFIILNPLEDRRVPGLLRNTQSDYDTIIREMPALYEFGYEASDWSLPNTLYESALVLMLFEVLRDVMRTYRPDVVVTTYPIYQAPLAAVYALTSYSAPLITVITDLVTIHRCWFHEAADLCIVPTEAAQELALAAGLSPERVRISGIPVHPRLLKEQRAPQEIRAELGWRPDLTTILVVGSKRVGNLPGVLRVLNHSGLPVQLAVAAGGDDLLYEQLQSVTWHLPTYLYNYVTNIPTMMHASDAIICKAGGLIVTESLAAGLPLLLVDVLPGQERGNAQYVTERQAGELVEHPVDALEALCHWLLEDQALLRTRAARARDLGRPHAAYDIAAWAWEAGAPDAVRRPRQDYLMPRLGEFLRRSKIAPDQ